MRSSRSITELIIRQRSTMYRQKVSLWYSDDVSLISDRLKTAVEDTDAVNVILQDQETHELEIL